MKTNNTQNQTKTTSEDRRIRRTKKLLKNALMELTLEKGYDEVNVQEIIDRADVGRTSFYTHFRSKEDLLLQNLDDLQNIFEPAPSENTDASKTQDFSLMMFLHLKENWRLAKVLLGNKKIPIVRNYVQNILVKYYKKKFQEEYAKTKSPMEIEGAAVFTSGALISLTLWWLSMDKPATPEKMHEMFISLVKEKQQR